MDPHTRSVARRGHERPLLVSGRYAGRYDVSHPWHVGTERWATWGGCLACLLRYLQDEERWLTGECKRCKPKKIDPPAPIRHVDGYPLVPCPCGAVKDRRPGALVAWEVYTRSALHLPVERFSQLEAEDQGGKAVMLPFLPRNDESRMAWEGEGEDEAEPEDGNDPTRGNE